MIMNATRMTTNIFFIDGHV
ncbi:hypothetical protein C1631_009535 [Chryseobacterium phosphatilyticum]|uniref:Uncharacterized protein n=1 Tax=Chryseobacterium phosphatilyticum TaxID=475075 RepID=A0A316XIR5_9FLAO|nr:hypothetical protein C1631_009535 [Chryseobacterium phosphatilyticum]